MPWTVYSLSDPRSLGVPRYVGKSHKPEKRLKRHVSEALNGSARSVPQRNWFAELSRAAVKPVMEVLRSNLTCEEAEDCERSYIRQFLAQGFNLTNCRVASSGGWNTGSRTPRQRPQNRLVRGSPEWDAMVLERNRKTSTLPDFGSKVSAGLLAANIIRSEETRRKLGAAIKLQAARKSGLYLHGKPVSLREAATQLGLNGHAALRSYATKNKLSRQAAIDKLAAEKSTPR